MKDDLASIEKLRADAAEAAIIRDFVIDKTRRENVRPAPCVGLFLFSYVH